MRRIVILFNEKKRERWPESKVLQSRDTPHNKSIKRVLLFLALLGGALWGWDVWQDRQHKITVLAPTLLYSTPEAAAYQQAKPLQEIPAGAELAVLRIEYGKDFRAVQVLTDTGEKAWLLTDSRVSLARP